MVYVIARRTWNRATGLVAAFFLSIAFLHVRDSHFGTTDITMTFFMMLSMAFLLDAHRDRQPSSFALAGLCGGLAAARQDAFFVPFAGFGGVKRPGPNFSIFKREKVVSP